MTPIARAIAIIVIDCAIAVSSHATEKNTVGRIQTDMVAPSVRINDNCSGTLVFSQRDPETGHATTYVLTAAHCAVVKSGRYVSNRHAGVCCKQPIGDRTRTPCTVDGNINPGRSGPPSPDR